MRSIRFLGSLITNLKSKFRNSKWRIQYGRSEFKKRCKSYENVYLGVLGLTDYESVIRFPKFKMTNPI